MSNDSIRATTVIPASADDVFAILADPSRHTGIDGTGWVTAAVDTDALSRSGQLFRMAMYHPDHADGSYETVNEVLVYDKPSVIAWRTGYLDQEVGEPAFAGWWWRYDLTPLGPARSAVMLTYDWSAVGTGARSYLTFPPFTSSHLDNSLRHLSQMLIR